MKKNLVRVGGLLAIIACFAFFEAFSMEERQKGHMSWLDTLEEVIFGNAPITQLFSFTPSTPETFEMVSLSEVSPKTISFSTLPKEIQNTIIGYLSTVIDSSDPVISAQAISSLAKVNKELNKKINDPLFTQKLIINFYEKFAGTIYRMPYIFAYDHLVIPQDSQMDISKDNMTTGYMAVAILLKTQGAKEWLKNCISFKQWVSRANQEYEQYWEDVRALNTWR